MHTQVEKVLIVGGSSGMGLALAQMLLAEGAEVTIVGRSAARLASARDHLGKAERLRTAVADIGQEAQVAKLFEHSGPLDHIVTTAADIEDAYRLLPSLQLDAVRRVIDSKFIGPLLLAKCAAPVLSARGSITFTSGIAAYRPGPRGSVVASINGALESLAYAYSVQCVSMSFRRDGSIHRYGDLLPMTKAKLPHTRPWRSACRLAASGVLSMSPTPFVF